MTAANWKTNEVQKPSLDSGVCVCACVDRVSDEVQKEGLSEGGVSLVKSRCS